MIYLLFLGLLYTQPLRAQEADPDDPCKHMECAAGCSSYRELCLATDGCSWIDSVLCSSSDGTFEGDCCYSSGLPSTTTMDDYSTTTNEELTTTPSPTSCYDGDDAWTIDEIGKSSQFRFISNCEDNKQFVKIKMVSLTEYDNKGKKTKNKITSFASSDWYWITNEDDEYEGFTADINKYVSTLTLKGNYQKKKVDFNLTTVLFREEAEIGNSTINQNTLKWTTDIDGWPFLDDNNTLKLCINVMTNGGNYAKSGGGTGDDEGNERFTFNDFEFRLIDKANCGDDEVDVETYKNQKNFNQMDICFTYNACDDVIDHDPFVYYIGNDDNNNNDSRDNLTADVVTISVGVGIAAFVLLTIAVLSGLYCRKNKKLRKGTTSLNSTKKGGYDALEDEV